MKMNFIKVIVFFFTASSFFSCKKFLDVTPDNVATIDYAFRNRNEAENYLFTCYNSLQQDLNDCRLNAGFTTSGEIIMPFPVTPFFNLGDKGFQILRGMQNTNEVVLNFWSGDNNWPDNLFKSIRQCNIFLQNVDNAIDLTPVEKERWIAEAKFLKAYYHYWLIRMYGPIPLVKKNLPINTDTRDTWRPRDHVDSCFNYVVSLLDEAIPDLPLMITNEQTEQGRITATAAAAVKAEVLATQASPLFNGNPDYTSFANKDDSQLFSPTFDNNKWVKAAEACRRAIIIADSARRRIYNYVPPANIVNISPQTKQLLDFQMAITDKWNQEIIWSINTNFWLQWATAPKLSDGAKARASIYGIPSVPISQAELFYTKNGVPISEDKTYNYQNRYALRTGDNTNRYYIRNGYTTINMHFDREPRFYASVGIDGGVWFGNGNFDDNNPTYIQARYRGWSGYTDVNRSNITGYWVKKLVHYQSVFPSEPAPISIINFQLPMIRLTDLYLLYAEAMNESLGPGPEVYDYINKVRSRAGIPTVQESWNNFAKNPSAYTTKEGLRNIIHTERRIELAFEGRSGWDLRRWKELQKVLSTPMQGWNFMADDPAAYYVPKNIFQPIFGIKDYLWPIEQHDMVVNINLVQNPYW